MNGLNIFVISRKELHDSLRNRWFIFYAAAFTVLTLGLSYLSLVGTGMFGVVGFGRTTAGLVNLVLLIVPLMALTIGAASLAGERERGTLSYLLSQPVSRTEVLLGKFVGLATALIAALAAGFAASAALVAAKGGSGQIGGFAALVGMTFALALAMLGVGMCVSAFCKTASVATGVCVFLWLALVLLSDLGLMAGTIAFRLQVAQLFEWALANPLQVFKMAVLSSVHASLDVLGPAGTYASQTYGHWLALIFSGAMTAWLVVPMGLAWIVFARRTNV